MIDYYQEYLATLTREGNIRLTLEEQHKLIRKAQRGDAVARHKMILSVMLYAAKIARRYVNSGVDIEDLVSYSVDGIVRALEKFETSRGLRFTTYATWWIHQSIRRNLEKDAIIKLPVTARRDLGMLGEAQRRLVQAGARPTLPAVSAILRDEYKWNQDRIDRAWHMYQLREDDRIIGYQRGDAEYTILDTQFTTDDAAVEFVDNLDDVYKSPVMVKDAVLQLDDKLQEIIIRRFGLFGNRAQTLEEIAKSKGLTKERIRQLQVRAIRVLKTILAPKEAAADAPPATGRRPGRPKKIDVLARRSGLTRPASVSQCI